RVLAEAVWFGGCRNPERLRKKHLVEYSNIGDFEEAYTSGKGIVVLNSHFGNWELLGGCLNYDYRSEPSRPEGLEPDDIIFVYKPLGSKMWDGIMRENRCAPVLNLGYKGYISTSRVLRHVLENKDRKLVVNMLSDQCPYRDSTAEMTVDFLHQETRTMFGGASIAAKFGFSVFYMSLFPVRKGRYEWRFERICSDASEMTAQDIMQKYYDLLQADIEAVPWCYLWTHKRWKR
ncbi:MAG: lysophospholipid acyltransferase family protein, partial [Bacteroidales bacterium]|nr:lysophospholipid acyltransferase family protein [Bacteroidales bacterium]